MVGGRRGAATCDSGAARAGDRLRRPTVRNPLLPRAYALDGIAMAFAGAAVVDALEGVLLLCAWALTANDA
jgi:hypothetical protein